ncbi:UNVERIFIED_CONTAM: hypothetical protein Sradi_7294700 [Sesamum radiatum]|uniref:Uncharacterized protein n=1 Tax=Sesamum radiatum TaxID=300843 RepID=A0AAW2IHA4_SESRA
MLELFAHAANHQALAAADSHLPADPVRPLCVHQPSAMRTRPHASATVRHPGRALCAQGRIRPQCLLPWPSAVHTRPHPSAHIPAIPDTACTLTRPFLNFQQHHAMCRSPAPCHGTNTSQQSLFRLPTSRIFFVPTHTDTYLRVPCACLLLETGHLFEGLTLVH